LFFHSYNSAVACLAVVVLFKTERRHLHFPNYRSLYVEDTREKVYSPWALENLCTEYEPEWVSLEAHTATKACSSPFLYAPLTLHLLAQFVGMFVFVSFHH
jgi:hypothetical protein